MATNIEHQAFTALYDNLQTGIQSGIDDIVGKAFSKGLVPPHVECVSGNSSGPQSEGNRTSILLNAILERIQNLPDTYQEFASVLERITAFKYLADMMREKKSKITKDELETVQRQKEIEQVLRERKQDLHIHLPMENEKHDPHQGNSSVYHPASWSSSVSVQRAADDQFPLLRSFPQGEVGHKSPLGFRGRFSVSSTPAGLSPRNSSLISNRTPLKVLYKDAFPATQWQSPVSTKPVRSCSKDEPFSEPIPTEFETVKYEAFSSSNHRPIHKTSSVGRLLVGIEQTSSQMPIVSDTVINRHGEESSTSEIDLPVDSSNSVLHEPNEMSSLPVHTTPSPAMPTATVCPQIEDDNNPNVPSLQTITLTPMTSVHPSAACPPDSDAEDQPSAVVALRPHKPLADTRLLSLGSSISSTSSQDYHTPPSSPEIEREFNPTQESEGSQEQAVEAEGLQRLSSTSSCKHCSVLKQQVEQVNDMYLALKLQHSVELSAHSKHEEKLIEEIDSERKEKYELQLRLEEHQEIVRNFNKQNYDLHLVLRQHKDFISMLQNKVAELNQELKDVKVDAYDKGRALEQMRQYESQLDMLGKLPCPEYEHQFC